MSLKDQLTEDMKQAMRDGDKVKLGVIRILRSEIKNYEIDHGEQDDAGVEKIIAKEAKQTKESIVEYKAGGRDDLVTEEEAKLAVLESYMPKQMSDEELEVIVKKTVEGMDSSQMGPAIGKVMAQVQGKADGNRVSAMVKQAMQAS